MSTYKDILYKKNDDETWAEWSKRVPDNAQDKLDYIGETIYAKICKSDKEQAGNITGLMLVMGVEDLIPLLESEELLDAKIEEAYDVVHEFEEYKMTEEDDMFEEDCLSAEEELRMASEAARVSNEAWLVASEAARVSNEALLVEKEEDKEYEEQERRYEEEDDEYKQPVITLTVAEMIEALSKLPPDAKLVMTESGFYSKSDFAEVMLPRPYKVENDTWVSDLPTGTQVYIIGHSHQSY
jgi:hypothetical protein